MKIAIVVGSVTRTGNGFAVALKLAGALSEASILHADDVQSPADLAAYARFVFLTPTAGNEELPEPIERLFDMKGLDFTGREYAVCELGNYYGYDLYEYGAGKTVRRLLGERGGREFHPMLSLDTLPRTDWERFETWCSSLSAGAPAR